jgi:hypothetical protein
MIPLFPFVLTMFVSTSLLCSLCTNIAVDVLLKEFDLLHHLNLDGRQQGSMFSVKLDAS